MVSHLQLYCLCGNGISKGVAGTFSRSYHENCVDADPGTKANEFKASRQLAAGLWSGEIGESHCQTISASDRVLERFVEAVDNAGEAVAVFKGGCSTEKDEIVLRGFLVGKSNGPMDAAIVAKA